MPHFRLIVVLLIVTRCAAQSPAVPLWKTVPAPASMPAAADSGFFRVDGLKLYYAVFNKAGKGPMLLLHGGLMSSDCWGNEVQLLSQTHEVIVMDNREQGRSSLSTTPLHYEDMANDVVELLNKLHLRKASIVGWSDGGIMGLIVAMKHPDRIDRLFTYGANFSRAGEKDSPPDTAMSSQFMSQSLANYRRISSTPDSFPAMKRQVFTLYGREPELDTAELKKIKAPTVIAYGQHEQFYTQEHFATLARLIPGARLLELPNVSHGGPLQDPLAFHKAIMQWLK